MQHLSKIYFRYSYKGGVEMENTNNLFLHPPLQCSGFKVGAYCKMTQHLDAQYFRFSFTGDGEVGNTYSVFLDPSYIIAFKISGYNVRAVEDFNKT